MCRTLRFYAYMRDRWNDHARAKEALADSPTIAYARKQAHRYNRLINACRKRFGQHINFDEPSLRDALSDVQ
ncbi:hypothetical protein LXA43DRAFT_1101366 [Ganoderma leucocontextum]|nr:hypothetical protein LXA43DRAFT_1101366 [Ganoderma leucocontextum]